MNSERTILVVALLLSLPFPAQAQPEPASDPDSTTVEEENYEETTLEALPVKDSKGGTAASTEQRQQLDELSTGEREEARQERAMTTETSTNEDPDANRRRQQDFAEEADDEAPTGRQAWNFDVYGSARLHVINNYDFETDESESTMGDGGSRVGASAAWRFREGWELFALAEGGFNILDTFTAGALYDSGAALQPRLYHVGVDSENLYVKVGKSWSTYYTVAGATDRFAIFGGNAVGVYNAGTDGGATGTGRADDAIQTRLYIDPKGFWDIVPFNLNFQYQASQPIPRVRGQDYEYSYSASAWLENQSRVGIGFAYHRAAVDNPNAPEVIAAGIDGDAVARAVAIKSYGERWLASLVWADLDSIETTDQFIYFDGRGIELYANWNVGGNVWLVGGGNWLFPDDSERGVGDYEVKYGIMGVHYTFDSFRRMIYAEWRDDHGTRANGQSQKNEFTVGIRWDFGD
jgi:hypothetical protein